MELKPIQRGLSLVLFLLLAVSAAVAFAGQNRDHPPRFTLEMAYKTALKKNDQIAVSRQKLQQERENITIASSNLYPQISAEAGYTRQKVDDISSSAGPAGEQLDVFDTPRDYGTLTFKLDQHIYQFGKVWSSRQIAKNYFNGSKFRHIRQVKEILFNVSTRYYEVLLGRRSIEISENALKRAKEQLEQAKARFEVGILTRTDVLRARVQVAESQEQLERAKNQYEIALENLALELGRESVPGSIAEPPERNFNSSPISELYRTALEHRQDYRRAREQVQLAEKRVDFEQADYFPNLSLEGQYTRTNESALYYGEREDWQATLKLSYPLFTGWKTSAEVDQAKSGLMEANAALSRLKKEIRNQVRSVYLNIQTQKKVIEQLEEQVRSARRNYQQVTAQFEQGIVTAVDQIDAFTALNEAENRLAQAYYSYQLDQIRLKLATGTFQTDLAAKELSDDGNG
ncbi:MAG: TolC family protein [Desulfosalsimonadaceae bacterium]